MTGILIVEDNEDIRTDLAALLQDEGYEVATASDGVEALRVLDDGFSPALILLDLMMPVMDGWQFRREQLQNPALAGIPVVLLTGASNAREHALDLRAAGCLTKPIRLDRLLGTLSQLEQAPPAGA